MKSGLPSAVSARRAAASLLRRLQPQPGQLLRVLGAERGQRQRGVGRQPSAPRRTRVEQLGPREREQHDRQVAQPRGQQLDQVEQAAVGPVDVLEDEQRRPVARDGLDEAPHREEQLLAVVDRAFGVEPEQDRQVAGHGLGVGPGRQVGDVLAQLRQRNLGRVAVEDPAELLDLHREGEVGAALAVGERAAVDGAAAELLDDAVELLRQARLADPGGPDHGHEVRDALARDPLPDPAQHVELPRAADELARVLPLAGGALRLHRDPGLDRSGLALRLDRLGRLVLDRVLGGRIGLRPDDHAVHGRGRLQARGRVDDVARDERLAARHPRAERDERLARVDGDPELKVEVELSRVELLRAVADGQRAAHSALGVVAVGGRRAEDGHDRVADELLHRPAERLELPPDVLVVRAEDGLDVLRVETSARAVKPTRSTNTIETIRRSSCPAGWVESSVPQARQNRATSGFSWPQLAHEIMPVSVGI